MSDDKRDPAGVLARARRAWSPGEADAARVRRALGAALAAGPAREAGAASARPPGSASTWTSRFLVASAIAASSGGAGYWAGRRAGLHDARPAAPVVSVAPPSVAPVEPRSPVATALPPEAPSFAMPSLVPARHGAHGTRHESESRTPSQTESLAIEVRALRSIERALRDGNPGLALAFLQELDRQVPNGQLAEERDAAATVARCAGGDQPFGVNLAEEFAARHPTSVYRARAEQACAPADPPATGDSTTRRSER